MKTRAKTWDIGNIFAAPLNDGSYSIGHVVGKEVGALNSITCAFYKTRLKELTLDNAILLPVFNELLSVQFVTPDLLKSRHWKVVGKQKVNLSKKYFPYEETRKNDWIGAEVIGSGVIIHFLNAYFGLEPWDMMYEPDFFDKLLINSELKPDKLKYKDAT